MCWTTWTRKAQGSKGQRSGSANVASSNTSSPFKSSLLCAASVTALSHARSGPLVRDFTCGRATLLLFETSTLWIIFRRINNEPLSRWTRATPLLSPSNAVYPLFEAVARLTCFFFLFIVSIVPITALQRTNWMIKHSTAHNLRQSTLENNRYPSIHRLYERTRPSYPRGYLQCK